MTTSPSTTAIKAPFGRIRVDDTTSSELMLLVDHELAAVDRIRSEWAIRGQTEMAHFYNLYMRRLRRVLRELERTREEMGWSEVQLSELGQRQ